MPAPSQSVDLGDARRASYEVIGEGAPTLYFIGGPGYSAALLRPDAELLADHFAVYLIDPAGSGGSTRPRDESQYDHIGHALFYDEVRQALGLARRRSWDTPSGVSSRWTYAALFPQSTTRCVAVAARVVGAEIEGEEAAAEMQAFLARHSDQPWYPAARKTWHEWNERVLAAEEASEIDAMMAEVLPLYTAEPDRRRAGHARRVEPRADD